MAIETFKTVDELILILESFRRRYGPRARVATLVVGRDGRRGYLSLNKSQVVGTDMEFENDDPGIRRPTLLLW